MKIVRRDEKRPSLKITHTRARPKNSGRTVKPVREVAARRSRAELEAAIEVAEHERREWSKTAGRLEKTIRDLQLDVKYLDSMLNDIEHATDVDACRAIAKKAIDRDTLKEFADGIDETKKRAAELDR